MSAPNVTFSLNSKTAKIYGNLWPTRKKVSKEKVNIAAQQKKKALKLKRHFVFLPKMRKKLS